MMKKYYPILFILLVSATQAQDELSMATPTGSLAETSGTSEMAYELVSFVARAEPDEGVSLSWSTGAELPNSRFTIQRSRDRMNWSTVLTMDGEGAGMRYAFYQATDLAPPSGVSYYRLLASAEGTRLEPSDEFAVDYRMPAALRVAGDDGPGRFVVQGNGVVSELELLNNRGQFVPMELTYSGNTVLVRAQSLEAGTYFVQAMVDGKWVRRSVVVTATGVFGG